MKRTLIVGGANGIGLAIALELIASNESEKIYIVDKTELAKEYQSDIIENYIFDLQNEDYTFFDRFTNIDSIIITAGFGKLALFKDVTEEYIINTFNINTIASIRLIKHFYKKIESKKDFYCGIMVSIAGFISSPFFAVYGASKAALKIFIESVNVELEKSGTSNRILNISPGSIKGTSFNNGKTDLSLTKPLAKEIIRNLKNKNDLYIPQYEEIFKHVLERYYKDFRAEGIHSYEYKINSGRIK